MMNIEVKNRKIFQNSGFRIRNSNREINRKLWKKIFYQKMEQKMQKEKTVYDLEDRLIDFAVQIIYLAESLPKTKAGNHIAGQLIRCGTSPAPNYGEAQSAESRSDFIHKMKICLKELRETRVWLKMLIRMDLLKNNSKIEPLYEENNQLISIFNKSIITAKSKKKTS